MATIGVSKPFFAKYNANNGNPTYTDGGSMGKLTQVDVKIESTEDNKFHADNAVAESETTFKNGLLTLSPDDLSPEISAAILGIVTQAITDIDGVTDKDVVELIFDDDQASPYLGVGFIIKKQKNQVNKWRAIVLTKVVFSIPPDAAVTQGETIEWQVPELTAAIMRDESPKRRWKREATFSTEDQAVAYIKARLNITAA